jgi:hypothetical protein
MFVDAYKAALYRIPKSVISFKTGAYSEELPALERPESQHLENDPYMDSGNSKMDVHNEDRKAE